MEEFATSMNARFAPPYPYSEESQIVIAQRIWNKLVRNIQKFH